MVNNVVVERPAPAQAQPLVPTDPTAYYKVFWDYAAYYGEPAARAFYGLWSPPEGTPNPNVATTTQSTPVQQVNQPASHSSVEAKSNDSNTPTPTNAITSTNDSSTNKQQVCVL